VLSCLFKHTLDLVTYLILCTWVKIMNWLLDKFNMSRCRTHDMIPECQTNIDIKTYNLLSTGISLLWAWITCSQTRALVVRNRRRNFSLSARVPRTDDSRLYFAASSLRWDKIWKDMLSASDIHRRHWPTS